jgi:pimeloyl-ACP methyl ester carboxylesterase
VAAGETQLHINCQGEGSPTVILETLSGGTSAYWAWIQPEIAQHTRVCSYDRAGRGWSAAGPPADLWGTAENLHAILGNAGIEGPYVLAGHSIGGLYARAFAARHPDEVAGMVLLDAAHPEQYDRYPEYVAANQSYLRLSSLFPILAAIGINRLYFAGGGEIDFADLPPREHDEVAAFWSSPAYFENQRAEALAAEEIYAQAHDLGNLGDLPLAVVSAGANTPRGWSDLQAELAALSTNSSHLVLDEATHASLAFNPAHAREVSLAILKVVEAARP